MDNTIFPTESMRAKMISRVGAVMGLALFSAIQLSINADAATTTITPTNKFSYSANAGWIDWRGNTNNGGVIGEYVCSGYLYSANLGWISLGNGSPANEISYQNAAADDFGVNHDGSGNLRGYAYSANVGWISFEDTGAAKVNLLTGQLQGYAYSANCGWISLSNAVAHVQTGTIAASPLAENGLPSAWLLNYFGSISVNANDDPDMDGQTNAQEYLAGTNPIDPSDTLKITSFNRNLLAQDYNQLSWNAKPSRFYAVQYSSGLRDSVLWADYGYFNIPGVSATGFFDNVPGRFYRIRAYRPLQP